MFTRGREDGFLLATAKACPPIVSGLGQNLLSQLEWSQGSRMISLANNAQPC